MKKEKTPAKIKWAQGFLQVAGNIAPVTTINILTKLFYKPKKHVLKPPHLDCLKKADKFSFEVQAFRNLKKKISLSCYRWGKGEKTVLLVHGWDAKAIDFYKMIPVLVDEGYQVIAFDGPAHGSSEGDKTNLVDFKEVMHQLIKKKIGLPYAIVGHSMGGGAAAYLLKDYDIHVKKFVGITMPMISKRYFEGMFAEMRVPMKMQKAFFKNIEEEFGEPIERYNLVERKDPIKADDFLMIYDKFDQEVPYKDIKDFLAVHPEVRQLDVSGTGHYAVIKNKRVIEEIVEFLK
jgi:pimeloyl-ACP methyl ester carboxylesterase